MQSEHVLVNHIQLLLQILCLGYMMLELAQDHCMQNRLCYLLQTWVMANAEFTIVDKDTELVSAVACDCRYVEGHVAGDGLTMPMRCTESSWLADANCIDV
ncbi:TPA: hypothetical protein ACH3X2_14337 [Trebouxia sp. C0005]